MKKYIVYINFFFLLLVILVNGLANILPINGYNTGEISALYPNLFVPAGFTFAIWGLIYFLLFIWAIYFLLPGQRERLRYQSHGISNWFIYSCLGNISWIFAWHYLQIELSWVIMLTMLYCLIKGYQSLQLKDSPLIELVPVSIYLAWICVATIANSAALLVHLNVDGGILAPYISSGMIVLASILAIYLIHAKGDLFFGLVILWAEIGISNNQTQFPVNFTTILMIILLGSFLTLSIFNSKPYFKASKSSIIENG